MTKLELELMIAEQKVKLKQLENELKAFNPEQEEKEQQRELERINQQILST